MWDVLDQQIWSNKVHLTTYAQWGWEYYTDSMQLEHCQICITRTHESLITMQTFNYTNISPMPLFIIVIPFSFSCMYMKTQVILMQFWPSKKHLKNLLEVWKKPSYVWKLMSESSRKQKQLQRKNNENIHERICISRHHICAWKMHWIKKKYWRNQQRWEQKQTNVGKREHEVLHICFIMSSSIYFYELFISSLV